MISKVLLVVFFVLSCCLLLVNSSGRTSLMGSFFKTFLKPKDKKPEGSPTNIYVYTFPNGIHGPGALVKPGLPVVADQGVGLGEGIYGPPVASAAPQSYLPAIHGAASSPYISGSSVPSGLYLQDQSHSGLGGSLLGGGGGGIGSVTHSHYIHGSPPGLPSSSGQVYFPSQVPSLSGPVFAPGPIHIQQAIVPGMGGGLGQPQFSPGHDDGLGKLLKILNKGKKGGSGGYNSGRLGSPGYGADVNGFAASGAGVKGGKFGGKGGGGGGKGKGNGVSNGLGGGGFRVFGNVGMDVYGGGGGLKASPIGGVGGLGGLGGAGLGGLGGAGHSIGPGLAATSGIGGVSHGIPIGISSITPAISHGGGGHVGYSGSGKGSAIASDAGLGYLSGIGGGGIPHTLLDSGVPVAHGIVSGLLPVGSGGHYLESKINPQVSGRSKFNSPTTGQLVLGGSIQPLLSQAAAHNAGLGLTGMIVPNKLPLGYLPGRIVTLPPGGILVKAGSFKTHSLPTHANEGTDHSLPVVHQTSSTAGGTNQEAQPKSSEQFNDDHLPNRGIEYSQEYTDVVTVSNPELYLGKPINQVNYNSNPIGQFANSGHNGETNNQNQQTSGQINGNNYDYGGTSAQQDYNYSNYDYSQPVPANDNAMNSGGYTNDQSNGNLASQQQQTNTKTQSQDMPIYSDSGQSKGNMLVTVAAQNQQYQGESATGNQGLDTQTGSYIDNTTPGTGGSQTVNYPYGLSPTQNVQHHVSRRQDDSRQPQ